MFGRIRVFSPEVHATLAAIANFLDMGNGSHILQMPDFMYGTGTKILTLSGKKPLPIIYQEICAMGVKLG